VTLIHEDARKLSAALLQERAGVGDVDGLLCTLGLSVVPDWQAVFAKAFALVRPGGRCVLMDGRMWRGPGRVFDPLLVACFKWVAAADHSRPIASLLEGRVDDVKVSYTSLGMASVARGTKR
jgi:hypothetical protein